MESETSHTPDRWDAWLRSPVVAWSLAGVVAIVALAQASDPVWLHDEGLLTYGFARAMWDEPLAMLFFQKCKPVLAIAYAVPAALGLSPFLYVHAVVAALGVPLAHDAARSLGARWPNVAALVFAASPFLLHTTGPGLSNGDGVVMAGAAIALLARGRYFTAGVVVSLASFTRFEIGLLLLPVCGWAALDRERRPLLAGAAVFPAVYFAAGALYHADPLWFVHYPPNISAPNEAAGHAEVYASHTVGTLVGALAAVTPALVLALHQPRPGLARVLLTSVALFVGVFAATHLGIRLGPLFVLGFSSRYAMVALALLAPLVALAVEPSSDTTTRQTQSALVGSAIVLGLATANRDGGALTCALAVGAGAVVAVVRSTKPRAAVPLLALLLVAGVAASSERLARDGFGPYRELEAIASMLERQSASLGSTLYTNDPLVAPFLSRTGRATGLELVYLVAPDQRYELDTLTSEAHDQRGRVSRALLAALFGRAVDPSALESTPLPPGTAFLVRDAPPFDEQLRAAAWFADLVHLDETASTHLYVVPLPTDPTYGH